MLNGSAALITNRHFSYMGVEGGGGGGGVLACNWREEEEDGRGQGESGGCIGEGRGGGIGGVFDRRIRSLG